MPDDDGSHTTGAGFKPVVVGRYGMHRTADSRRSGCWANRQITVQEKATIIFNCIVLCVYCIAKGPRTSDRCTFFPTANNQIYTYGTVQNVSASTSPYRPLPSPPSGQLYSSTRDQTRKQDSIIWILICFVTQYTAPYSGAMDAGRSGSHFTLFTHKQAPRQEKREREKSGDDKSDDVDNKQQ